MSYRVIVADGPKNIEDQLNGVLSFGPLPDRIAIGAKTLVFTSPSATCTFSGSSGAVLTLSEIIDEILATTGLEVLTLGLRYNPVEPIYRDGDQRIRRTARLTIALDGGFTIDKDGTANALLGIPTAADTVAAGAVATTDIMGFSQGTTPGQYLIIVAIP